MLVRNTFSVGTLVLGALLLASHAEAAVPQQLLALDPAGEAGVPLQLEGAEGLEGVGEGGRDAVDVPGQHAVAARICCGDHLAEHLSATVEGRPGHGLSPFGSAGPWLEDPGAHIP